MTPDYETMTDREIAEEAHELVRDVLDSNRNLRSIAGRALAVVDEYSASKQRMVGVATLANMHFKQLTAVHFALHRALVVFVADLRERDEVELGNDLNKICSAAMSSLENTVLQEPGKMH